MEWLTASVANHLAQHTDLVLMSSAGGSNQMGHLDDVKFILKDYELRSPKVETHVSCSAF